MGLYHHLILVNSLLDSIGLYNHITIIYGDCNEWYSHGGDYTIGVRMIISSCGQRWLYWMIHGEYMWLLWIKLDCIGLYFVLAIIEGLI